MVFDRYEKVWPAPKPFEFPREFNLQDMRKVITTQKTAIELFQEIVTLTKKLDEMLGLPDCEDPKKMEWLEKIKAQIIELEKKRVEDQLKI